MKIIRPISFFCLLSLTLLSACRQNPVNNGIPFVPVDIYIYTSDPAFIDLSVVGGWTYVTGGSRGIIIYRSAQDLFMAYDRHTPVSPNESCALANVDDVNLVAIDPCSDTRYSLFDGTVVEGEGTLPLQQYRTSFDNTLLHIYN